MAAPLDNLLCLARQYGTQYGITRVTDITRLDRIGIPVFAAIRPGGLPGSLCVHAGKGLTPRIAEMGAWMEGLEYALSEPDASDIPICDVLPEAILDGSSRPEAILDFCPKLGAKFLRGDPLPAVRAAEFLCGQTFWVPAECVFVPFLGKSLRFGYSSTGIAAGFSPLDAQVHGLNEVIERDIFSFQTLRDRSQPLLLATLPGSAQYLKKRITLAGLRLEVRSLQNRYQLPCFHAIIHDPSEDSPLFVNAGYACHPHREHALVGAILEAAQSRLSVIHGGRDDLEEIVSALRVTSPEQQKHNRARLLHKFQDFSNAISFSEIYDEGERKTTQTELRNYLVEKVHREGMSRILMVTFTKPESPIHVLKVIVPGMEEFEPTCPRMGKRLAAWIGT